MKGEMCRVNYGRASNDPRISFQIHVPMFTDNQRMKMTYKKYNIWNKHLNKYH